MRTLVAAPEPCLAPSPARGSPVAGPLHCVGLSVEGCVASAHGVWPRGYIRGMARKDISLSEEELATFLASGHTLQVATIDAHGYPHLAPMWYVVREGKIVFRSFTKSQKIVNLRRNPRLSVLLETGEAYTELRGAMIRGTATLVDDRAFVLEIYGELAAKYEMIGGRRVELDTDALETAFGRFADKNTVVIVEPEKIATWDHTKLEGAY